MAKELRFEKDRSFASQGLSRGCPGGFHYSVHGPRLLAMISIRIRVLCFEHSFGVVVIRALPMYGNTPYPTSTSYAVPLMRLNFASHPVPK
jgi:hypothetical protein